MKQKLLSVLLLCTLLIGTAYAQSRTISGTVTSAEDGTTLPGVSVLVQGTNTGTQTDANGNYTLNVPANASALDFRFIGFVNQTITLGASSTINVVLVTDASELAEVVVIGYGTGTNIGSVVGSVSHVSGAKLAAKPSANALDALQGKVPGLQIFTSSGEPSATPSIKLHGVGSLGAGSTPLFVMDGIPMSSGAILSLNSDDFESVTILKDASATSIYGSRAANGVVYITSKKGSRNKAATITLRGQYGVSNIANTDPFTSFMNTKQLTDFWVETGYRTQEQVDKTLADWPNDTRWFEEYYKKNTPTYQGNLSVSGGSEKTTYFVSGSYFDQEGLAYRSNFKRYTLRSNIASTVNDWFKFGVNLVGSIDDRQENPYGTNSTNRGLIGLAQPFYSPIDPKTGKKYPDMIPGWGRYSPEYLANKNPFNGDRLQVLPSAYIELTPLAGLTVKSQAGLEFYDYRTSFQTLPSYIGSLNNGSATEMFDRVISRTITNTVEYKFNVADRNNFNVLVGQEYLDGVSTGFLGSSTGHSDDRLILLGAGPNNKNATSYKNEYVYNSIFGRIGYDFESKYYADVTLRQDASSRFGKDNRTATFWSLGGMWKMKQEEFLRDVDWLTDLNLRASVGTSGNSDIGNYQSQALVGTNQYDGNTGWLINTAGNPLLGWESQRKTTVGVDFNLFGKATIDLSYYNRATSNMLINVPFPYTSGFSSVTTNVGTLENNGIDLGLNLDVYNTTDFYLGAYVNLNYNKNKITELFQDKDYWIVPNTGVSWAVGKPVSYFYPIFAGVNPETGAPQWYKPSDNIVDTKKDPNDVTSDFIEDELQQSTGLDRYPPFNGGFGLNAGYKGFYLEADFTFSKGKYLINNDRYFFENPNAFAGFNQSERVLDYWKKPGDNSLFPSYDYQFTQFDSRLIEDASFLRLKTFTLGYNVPKQFLNSTKFFSSARVFMIGRNMLTFTNYLGPDPEVDSNLSLGANPNTKQLTFGIELQF